SKMKARLDRDMLALARRDAEDPQKIAIKPWTLHDVRRTVRTRLSSLGVLPSVAELVIGHKQQGMIKVYDRHLYDAEKRDALPRWAKELAAILAPPEPASPRSSQVRPSD